MRTYGRIYDPLFDTYQWVEVGTDVGETDDAVWTTTLCQCLRLSLNESPFYADYGIPAQQSIIQQIFPDFYVTQTQSRFAQYFTSLSVAKLNLPAPVYNINAITLQGAKVALKVPT